MRIFASSQVSLPLFFFFFSQTASLLIDLISIMSEEGNIHTQENISAIKLCQKVIYRSLQNNTSIRNNNLLRAPHRGTRGFQSPPDLPADGAVIFGHSYTYPLRWANKGDPSEGDLEPDEPEDGIHDSGIGTSVSSTGASSSIALLSQHSPFLARGDTEKKAQRHYRREQENMEANSQQFYNL